MTDALKLLQQTTDVAHILALEIKVAALEAALSKQRAVNKALVAYEESSGYEERNERFPAVIAALRDALR
jgi:hypothetical protein